MSLQSEKFKIAAKLTHKIYGISNKAAVIDIFLNFRIVNKIAIRTADRPEGPWSDAQDVVECIAPTNEKMWSYCGLAHPELSREAGRIEYLTYYRETGFFKGEIRLIELVFK